MSRVLDPGAAQETARPARSPVGVLTRCLQCLVRSGCPASGVLGSPVCRPLGGLALAIFAALLLTVIVPPTSPGWATVQIAALVVAASLVAVLYHRIETQLLAPLASLRDWALRIRNGDMAARMPVPPAGELVELAGDINDLSDELRRLREHMDQEVCKHTESLAQKTRSLQVLYDVAASVNIFNDLDDLLTRFLHTLAEVTRARAAAVHLMDDDGGVRLVASVGLTEGERREQQELSLEQCLRGATVTGEGGQPAGDGRGSHRSPLVRDGGMLHTVAVPLGHHGHVVGMYNLFVDRADLLEREDMRALLTSIGRHLGMAIEKVRLDHEAQRLSIMQERTLLAHELHDSLAQTLASLRFRVRVLDDSLQRGLLNEGRQELERVRNGLEEANTELRELLAHFRAPLDTRGLLPALEDLIARFRHETGIVIFFQKECPRPNLPVGMEVQVLRIVQEALANIRKHSQAHAVRILVRCDRTGQYRVMVEDDGVGLPGETVAGRPGEHLGLSILQERARRLGGELSVESEPAEGTRVELSFHYTV